MPTVEITEKLSEAERKVKDFSDLLESIETTADKKKLLWKEIYENAIVDRMNAYMLFTDAYTNMGSGTAYHMQVGAIMAKYLERMGKSNEQLLKLADLISSEEEKAAKIDPDDLSRRIYDCVMAKYMRGQSWLIVLLTPPETTPSLALF